MGHSIKFKKLNSIELFTFHSLSCSIPNQPNIYPKFYEEEKVRTTFEIVICQGQIFNKDIGQEKVHEAFKK